MASFYESQSSSNGRSSSGTSWSHESYESWNYDSLKNFCQISPRVQIHLKLVYLTLCCALGASAVGAYLHILMNIGGLLTFLGVVGGIIWVTTTPPHDERKRFGILMGTALLEGATVGPLIERVIEFDPSILVSAFGGTALAFGCFSAAAVVAKRREFLYLGGLLSSGLTILMWLRFASSIFGSTATFSFELYFGLMIFLGYVVFDTQSIIERAHQGDLDYVKHALVHFVDFIGILVRILIIMMDNAEKSEEKKKKRSS